MGKKFDERDIIFARKNLKPNTKEYEEYYSRRPENKDKDDILRSINRKTHTSTPIKSAVLSIKNTAIESALNENKLASDAPVHKQKIIVSPREMSEIIKKAAKVYGADIVGITKRYDYSNYSHKSSTGEMIDLNYRYAIVVADALDMELVNCAPNAGVSVVSIVGYANTMHVISLLVLLIKSFGYDAIADNYASYLSPVSQLGITAGIGQLSRSNMLVNPKYGNKLKLSALWTDLPLIEDGPIDFGLVEFCEKCSICCDNCPVDALSYDKPISQDNSIYWPHDENKCMTMWQTSGGDCGICMSVCPFSQGVDESLVSQMKSNHQIMNQILDEYKLKHPKPTYMKKFP